MSVKIGCLNKTKKKNKKVVVVAAGHGLFFSVHQTLGYVPHSFSYEAYGPIALARLFTSWMPS